MSVGPIISLGGQRWQWYPGTDGCGLWSSRLRVYPVLVLAEFQVSELIVVIYEFLVLLVVAVLVHIIVRFIIHY